MHKRNLLTAMGILLSLCMAFGGWIFTGKMLERKEKSLISPGGTMQFEFLGTTRKEIGAEEEEEVPVKAKDTALRPKLTGEEMAEVIQSWESRNQEHPHEPVGEQLMMEEAIQIGKEWITILEEQMGIPDHLLAYDNINAYLCNKNQYNDISEDFYQYFSYWYMVFSGQEGKITLKINAVTGQVWDTGIMPASSDITFEETINEQVLDAYASYLGVTVEGTSEKKENYIYKGIGDGNLSIGIHRSMTASALSTGVFTDIIEFEKEIIETEMLRLYLTINLLSEVIYNSETTQVQIYDISLIR